MRHSPRLPLTAAALLVALFAPGIVPAADPAGSATVAPVAPVEAETAAEEEAVRLFREALRAMRSSYVDAVPAEELAQAAVRAMVGRDRWSTYLTPDEYKATRMKGDGAMVGIGLRFVPAPAGLLVTETFANSPASAAGLAAGDVITAIDGAPAAGLDRKQAATALRGEPGTTVALTVARGGDQGAEAGVTVAREILAVPSVSHRVIGTVGYLRIVKFDRRTLPGIERGVEALRTAIGDGLGGLVIDLRGNPGGLVRAAVGAADAFLDDGTILMQEGRDGAGRRSYRARPGDIADGLPLVLLVDERSASSAEILAGALRDNGRAVLVGTKTYGKGVIQTFLPVKGGGAIKLTTARYRTPSGQDVNGQGLAPDLVVPMPSDAPAGADPQLDQALAVIAAGR